MLLVLGALDRKVAHFAGRQELTALGVIQRTSQKLGYLVTYGFLQCSRGHVSDLSSALKKYQMETLSASPALGADGELIASGWIGRRGDQPPGLVIELRRVGL